MKCAKTKLLLIPILLLTLLYTSCLGDPDPVEDPIEDIQEDPIEDTTEPDIIEEPQDEEFIVTQEIYDNTFVEIEDLIDKLNRLISNRNYSTWQEYLSDNYIQRYSDSEALEQMSQSPILMDNGIRLRSLEDYFNYIVVPSRSNTVVNDIEFEGEDRITVWSMFNGNRVKLYQLERIDDNWKISIW